MKVWNNLVVPVLGVLVYTRVWLNLSCTAMIAGFSCLVKGELYLGAITRGLRPGPASLELP